MKRLNKTFLLAAAVIAVLIAGCKSQYDILLEGNDIDAKYAAAFDYFNQGKYTRSAQLFESLASITKGLEMDDTVQYYWGLSNYRMQDFYTAETNFLSFVTNYPLSPFAEAARFYRIDCLYRQTLRYELDQSPTHSAVAAISEYLSDYPESPYRDNCLEMLDDLGDRIDRKAYENARLYYTMEDYRAARVALKNVLKDNSENRYREQVLYYSAMASFKYADMSVKEKQRERYITFVDDYLNFVGEYPESSYRKELDTHYRAVQKILGGTGAVPGESVEEPAEAAEAEEE